MKRLCKFCQWVAIDDYSTTKDGEKMYPHYPFCSKKHKEEYELRHKDKSSLNGKGLPFENSPEIYGNQRVESYKKGYNTALSEIRTIIEGKIKEYE